MKFLPEEIESPIEARKDNYVIVIDEINRANISRVFGELITLIEPDKRSHGDTPLEVKLPSGDHFVVPSNLYIIGTMNTADKSISLLDIALRRRFEFEPMYPLYKIEGSEIYDADILLKLNEQIIKLKGYDFQVGHAYFMGENNDLLQRMNKKVIPLLLEYFMNDFKEVKNILFNAGLQVEENSWPLRITGKRV
jgi:5-methylcytosine-specific restriction protein B